MKVRIISGKLAGLVGEIRGDLDERKKTLGRTGKVLFHSDRFLSPIMIRTKHLSSELDLFSFANVSEKD